MRRLFHLLTAFVVFTLLCVPSVALGTTRALLVACSDFVTQEDLGAATSGNLHMVGSALISADIGLGNLHIEDGTIGTIDAFRAAIDDAFSHASEEDLSILYLCTHGVLSSSDDEQVYLLLGDGQTESPLSGTQLYDLVRDIQGEKLLIIDACYSGALIGRGQPEIGMLPGSRRTEPNALSPFLLDSSIHVLTSSSGSESSWYYDSEGLSSGAVSYFASALSSGLGLYGSPEADLSGDGAVSLPELHRYLSVAVPSSSCQLLSTRAANLLLPVSQGAMLYRPLMGFSYGTSLLSSDDPVLDFSFTVTRDKVSVQYRLVDFADGSWDWDNAKTFLDEGDDGSALFSAGRKMRTLSLDSAAAEDSGYLMLQVFSVMDNEIQLCSERLIAVQNELAEPSLSIRCRSDLRRPGLEELPIDVRLNVPAELTVSVHDAEGMLVRRLASSQLTRPSADGVSHLYWDGRDTQGTPVAGGAYTLTAEMRIGASRHKASCEIKVGF
ncbi:MAG: CHAT domain-containing protein [Clostridiales bacterium]|nr:CHAT domain-containing protein [Clostridiales bacterium]